MESVWNRLNAPKFGLANRVSDMIAALEWRQPGSMADVRGSSELLVACDFAGSHKGAKFEGFGFLIGAIAGAAAWMEKRRQVRESFLSDGRRMAYKSLNDERRRKALLPFLAAANAFPANLFVFLISKEIRQLFDDPGNEVLFPELIVAVRTWKAQPFHRLLLVATLGSILVSGLSGAMQDILWITDQDEIAPNPKQHDHAGHVIHHCLSTYAPRNSGLLAFLTTEGKFDDFMLEDVVAIPDLAAGALINALDSNPVTSPSGFWLPGSNDSPLKSKSILWWLADDRQALRRFVVVLDRLPDGNLSVSACSPIRYGNGQVFLVR
jgi:hypothetical protein